MREEKKKPAEPRVSIPLTTVSTQIKRRIWHLHYNLISGWIDEPLALLGATSRETEDIKALLKRSEFEIKAEELGHIKVSKPSDSEIRIDKVDMEEFAIAVARKSQGEIRSILPSDVAEVLVSSINWDKYYPIDEATVHLSIARKSTGELQLIETYGGVRGMGPIDLKFDTGMPIPADQLPNLEAWKPFLKGITLLPHDE